MADPHGAPAHPPSRGMVLPNGPSGPPLPPRPKPQPSQVPHNNSGRRVSDTPTSTTAPRPHPTTIKPSKTVGQIPEQMLAHSSYGQPMHTNSAQSPPPVPYRSSGAKKLPLRTSTESSALAGSQHTRVQTTPVRHATTYQPSLMTNDVYVSALSPNNDTTVKKPTNIDSRPIEEQDWYWSGITKEEVTFIMKDMPDGSFLVRDAARIPGYYTLTLRKGGVNRLIRILHRNGLYGFADPLEFTSVNALVAYYTEHSLAPYSPKLDITLKNPVSRKQLYESDDTSRMDEMTPEQLVDQLHEVERQLHDLSLEYNSRKKEFEKGNEELKIMRLEIASQKEIISMFEESIKEHKKLQSTCPAHNKAVLLENYETLNRRLRMYQTTFEELSQKLIRREGTKNLLDTELNNLKPRIKSFQAEKGTILRVLNQRGWRDSEIEARLKRLEAGEDIAEEEGLYATYAMLHTYRKDSDYQRISESLKKHGQTNTSGGGKRPPPWPSNSERGGIQTPPRRLPTEGGGGSANPQHQQSTPSHAGPGSNTSLPPRQRDRLDTITFASKQHRTSGDAGYDSYDGQLISYKHLSLDGSLPHFDQSTWMNPSISREGSRDILTGRPNGTFLVRQKGPTDEIPLHTPAHSHSIDIVDQGKFKRIPVFRDPHGGYGFAPPYEFDCLLSLVLYYATNTMERHNPDLETTLKFPAFCPPPRR